MSKYRRREIEFFQIPNGSMVISFNRSGAESKAVCQGAVQAEAITRLRAVGVG